MDDVKTVSFEVLRLGPAHNQLLSPIQEYIAHCGSHEVSAFHVPWEHAEFLDLLAGLRYQEGAARARDRSLDSLGKPLGEMLGSVPGVVDAINGHAGDRTLVNLEIVVSAGELALLPFEAAKRPSNCVGSEEWLSLQRRSEIVITRRIRTVSGDRVEWPSKPRVLMVAAQPGALTVPIRQHVRALSESVQPFLRQDEPGDIAYVEAVSKLLDVLPAGSMESIQRKCREADPPFTHVHVLAHGAPTRDGSFGLLLHDNAGRDPVSGERFAEVLSDGSGKLPVVVTLAACDSGNVGDVVHSGASFAHQLHKAEIPFVVASQLPLTFGGSVRLVRSLYGSLLWGEDPRPALHALRQDLHALDSEKNHDWASIVCYAALPTEFDAQLDRMRYKQARAAMDGAMDRLDIAIDAGEAIDLHDAFAEVEEARSRMPTDSAYTTEVIGLEGAVEKRKAEACYKLARRSTEQGTRDAQLRQMIKHLSDASRRYEKAAHEAMIGGTDTAVFKVLIHWVLTQHVSLETMLGTALDVDSWVFAKKSAVVYLDNEDETERVWAYGTLAELYLLRPSEYREEALEAARMVAKHSSADSFERYSTVRQFRRYLDWWSSQEFERGLALTKRTRDGWADLVDLAREIDVCLEGEETLRERGRGQPT